MTYIDTIKDIEQRMFKLHPEVEEMYMTINSLKRLELQLVIENQPTNKGVNLKSVVVYDPSWPVAQKIKFALDYIGVFSKVSEIEAVIRNCEPKFDKGFSTPLNKLKEAKEIVQYNPTGSNRDVHYGLKTWANDDIPKEEYLKKE